jgi:hypothetical protein
LPCGTNQDWSNAAKVTHINLDNIASNAGGDSSIDRVSSGGKDFRCHHAYPGVTGNDAPIFSNQSWSHRLWCRIGAGNERTAHPTSLR